MEIIEILPGIHRFKDTKCSECHYRFGCWTSQSTCCPLKAVRVIEEEVGDMQYWTKISINNNLGKFDHLLLAKIGEDLLEVWNEDK